MSVNSNPVRVKICGVTSVDDALMVADAGADAIGLNFVGGPRQIGVDHAEKILRRLPPLLNVVALVDVGGGDLPQDILELLGTHWVSQVQMYGAVGPQTIMRLRRDGMRPIYVAYPKGPDWAGSVQTMLDVCGEFGPAAILLDAYDDGLESRSHTRRPGGTGQVADWRAIAAARAAQATDRWPPVMLAGGLTPDNVARAIALCRPWGVDVASGVERAPGRKDPALVKAFVQAVRSRASF